MAAVRRRYDRPRVYVPYVTLYPQTERALANLVLPVTLVYCPARWSYTELLRSLWRAGDTFILCEQDIGPRAGDDIALLTCPEDWCGFVYANTDRYAGHLGFTKFSSSLLRREPDVIDVARTYGHPNVPAGHWVWLDNRLRDVLEVRGYHFHSHVPPVPHYNPRQQIQREQQRGFCRWPCVPGIVD